MAACAGGHGRGHLRRHRQPDREQEVLAADAAQRRRRRPGRGRPRRRRAAARPNSTGEPGRIVGRERVERRRVDRAEHRAVAAVRDRLLRVHVDPAQRRRRGRRERVHLGLERAQRRERRGAPAASPAYAPSITTTERPDRNGGSSGSGGKCMMPDDVVTSSGARRGPARARRAAPRRARSYGPQQHARVDLAVREQRELHRGHDAEVAAAAAQRPEQVRVHGRRRARTSAPSAVTSSIAVHAVGGEAVLAARASSGRRRACSRRRRRRATSPRAGTARAGSRPR